MTVTDTANILKFLPTFIIDENAEFQAREIRIVIFFLPCKYIDPLNSIHEPLEGGFIDLRLKTTGPKEVRMVENKEL